ncbi:MAG: IS200/IS605 family transposase [Dehalococcoidales bacterium]|nr:IS200/IS605 family transposase [Dehalococcoidales bacterium]
MFRKEVGGNNRALSINKKITMVNHDKDHIHILASISPTMSVGKVVGIIKQNTTRELKQKFPFLKQVYWGTDAVWSPGFFVSTVGVERGMILKYVEHQQRQDSGQAKLDL